MIRSINYIITKDKAKTDLAPYLHGANFLPQITTFTKAINNDNFVTWLGIDDLICCKLLGTTNTK